MSNIKDPNRPCPDCGRTPSQTNFRWTFNKRTGNESRQNRCRECSNEKSKIGVKCRGLQQRYGITEFQYNLIAKSQNNCCALCGLPFGGEVIDLDHNHKTNQVRGILHHKCNMGLGWIENEVFLKQALVYLEKSK